MKIRKRGELLPDSLFYAIPIRHMIFPGTLLFHRELQMDHLCLSVLGSRNKFLLLLNAQHGFDFFLVQPNPTRRRSHLAKLVREGVGFSFRGGFAQLLSSPSLKNSGTLRQINL